MKVHEIMTAHPRSIAPENTLVEAAGLMRELDVGALPVCDNGTLTGMVTDRDMVVRGIADGQNPHDALVRDVMSGAVEHVMADDEVERAIRVMEQRQIRRLPVLDRAQRLVGMISLGDIATSSNPAFSGLALRDVSEPNAPSARRRRLARESEPAGGVPHVPDATRGPAKRRAASRRTRDGSASQRKGAARRAGTTHQRTGRRAKSAPKSKARRGGR